MLSNTGAFGAITSTAKFSSIKPPLPEGEGRPVSLTLFGNGPGEGRRNEHPLIKPSSPQFSAHVKKPAVRGYDNSTQQTCAEGDQIRTWVNEIKNTYAHYPAETLSIEFCVFPMPPEDTLVPPRNGTPIRAHDLATLVQVRTPQGPQHLFLKPAPLCRQIPAIMTWPTTSTTPPHKLKTSSPPTWATHQSLHLGSK